MSTTSVKQFNLFIDGKISNSSGRTFDCINPSNGELWAQCADATLEEMNDAIDSAREAFDSGIWSHLRIRERGQYLIRIAQLIREDAKELADLETLSTGKTLKHSTFIDVPTCADTFEYFGNISSQLDGRVNNVAAPVKSTTEFEPIGVVGAIVPWNYPLIITAWKIAPALIAGNTVVLKPSRHGCAAVLRLAQIIEEVGLPKGVLNVVTTTDNAVASLLVCSPKVDMISFTGGTETGQKIMSLASGATKKISLELGGKSPAIVLADCDFDAAVGGVISSIFMNQGQMCTACSRLIIEESIYEKFLSALVEKTKKLKIGSANDYSTDFGPLVNREHRDAVLKWIEKGKDEGATLVCGGKIPEISDLKNGSYLEPTIFTNVTPEMSIFQEEIFGPVLTVTKFSNSVTGAGIANNSRFGLAASVWTKDLNKAHEIAKELKCGTVWINTYGGFYNEASFGGFKQSGSGRVLGMEGLKEFTHSKNICIDQTPGGRSLVTSWF